jgi:hypothetical protein
MVPATKYFVGNLVALANIANDYLLTFSNHNSVDGTGIVSCA